MKIDQALQLIRDVPDFPKPGILFKDITPLLSNGPAFNSVTKEFASFADSSTVIAGIEARGFIFASAVANSLGSGFVPIRKAGKLPYESVSAKYGLEYGVDTLEIHKDAVIPGAKVLLIDDVLATGGTIAAAIDLIQRIGGEVVHVLALLEISGLSGRQKINQTFPKIPITSFLVS
jgi:adenine phosphoribosyltransferase